MNSRMYSRLRTALFGALVSVVIVSCGRDAGPVGESAHVHDHDDKHSHVAGSDIYDNFAELQAAEPNSYVIASRNVQNGNTVESTTIVFTPHGGSIEPGSTELADAIADAPTGPDYDYYSFTGVKSSNNSTLHITSTNFDEPTCVAMVAASTRTVALHGCSGNDAIVYVGGRDSVLKNRIAVKLTAAGFTVSLNPPGYLGGTSTSNICNRNIPGAGVQLELSRGLRSQLMTSLSPASARATSKTAAFYSFVGAVRAALAE